MAEPPRVELAGRAARRRSSVGLRSPRMADRPRALGGEGYWIFGLLDLEDWHYVELPRWCRSREYVACPTPRLRCRASRESRRDGSPGRLESARRRRDARPRERSERTLRPHGTESLNHAHAPQPGPRGVSQPAARARTTRIRFECPGSTCVCPRLGQARLRDDPDRYVPDPRACVELKSLKLYLWSFRDEGALPRGRDESDPRRPRPRVLAPRTADRRRRFRVRGGIHTVVEASHP